ncbi:hypothetical protein SDC9_109674 [bioreactor metagenome]|uniref:Uncharacterized protein n=1 Tax=bioreactor metagenome TaxID=1076179 RepID=A0A645BCH7_9ZZZZ
MLVVHSDRGEFNGDPFFLFDGITIHHSFVKFKIRNGMCGAQESIGQGSFSVINVGNN